VGNVGEDVHFYIDNAIPREVTDVLRILRLDIPMSLDEIEEQVAIHGAEPMQKDRTYSPKRLFDLGLAARTRIGGRPWYSITALGSMFASLLAVDPALYADSMHYLHYTRWDGRPQTRKLFWSYRECTRLTWRNRAVLDSRQLAAQVQQRMQEEFPHLDFFARTGSRFNSSGVSRWKRQMMQMTPPPFDNDAIVKRAVSRPEVALLSLDYLYRDRRYRYGDPVVLDDDLLFDLAGIFYLDEMCLRELLELAARVTPALQVGQSFAGLVLTLREPYGIERVLSP